MSEQPTEKEIKSVVDGFIFGDFGVKKKLMRKTSAYAVEDCHLFHISEGPFYEAFCKSIFKAEHEKRDYISKLIKPFEEINRLQFDIIFNTMTPLFFSKNEFVYCQNTIAESFYIVLHGSLCIENYLSDKPVYNLVRSIPLLKIEKGGIVGLDCFYNQRYKYTLRSDTNNTLVMCINLDNLDKDIKEKLKLHFKDIHFSNEKTFLELLRHRKERELKINWKKPFMNPSQIKDKIVQNIAQKSIKSTLEKIKLPDNNFTNFNVKVFNTEPDNLHNLEGKKGESFNKNDNFFITESSPNFSNKIYSQYNNIKQKNGKKTPIVNLNRLSGLNCMNELKEFEEIHEELGKDFSLSINEYKKTSNMINRLVTTSTKYTHSLNTKKKAFTQNSKEMEYGNINTFNNEKESVNSFNYTTNKSSITKCVQIQTSFGEVTKTKPNRSLLNRNYLKIDNKIKTAKINNNNLAVQNKLPLSTLPNSLNKKISKLEGVLYKGGKFNSGLYSMPLISRNLKSSS